MAINDKQILPGNIECVSIKVANRWWNRLWRQLTGKYTIVYVFQLKSNR